MPDPLPPRERLAEAARMVNSVLDLLDTPEWRNLAAAAELLEDAYMQWDTADWTILRTWLTVVKQDIEKALKRLEADRG